MMVFLSVNEYIMCSNKECNISPSSYDVVICSRDVITCVIHCLGYQQCKDGLMVYSWAVNTIINCNNIDSCYGSIFNINVTQSNDMMYNGNVIINCINKGSCKTSEIYINGDYINKARINAYGSDSFKDGILSCNVGNENICELDCYDAYNLKSCDNVKYLCNNNCQCKGDSCPIIVNQCKYDNCVIKPNKNELIVCTNKYDRCIIDCSYKESACKYDNNIKIYSGANNTIIKCNNKDACYGAYIHVGIPLSDDIPYSFSIDDFIGDKNSVQIDCDYETSCKESNIIIDGNFNHINIFGKKYDSIKSSIIECNNYSNKCELFCGLIEYNSCEDVTYTCYNTNHCICYGESCPDDSIKATKRPKSRPTDRPTNKPTNRPTGRPTGRPTERPTERPTDRPVVIPTDNPTFEPSIEPTFEPTNTPTIEPTLEPTVEPTNNPTPLPTPLPTPKPSPKPSRPTP